MSVNLLPDAVVNILARCQLIFQLQHMLRVARQCASVNVSCLL